MLLPGQVEAEGAGPRPPTAIKWSAGAADPGAGPLMLRVRCGLALLACSPAVPRAMRVSPRVGVGVCGLKKLGLSSF